MPITKFKEKVKDTNIFSFGISFVKRLNLSEIQISQEEPKQEETKNAEPETEEEKPVEQPKEKPKEESKEETKKEQKEEVKDKPKEEQKEQTKESEPASNPEQDKKESGYITRQEFTIKSRREIEKILTQPNYVPNPQQYHGNMSMGYQQPHQVYPPHYVAHGAIGYGPHGYI